MQALYSTPLFMFLFMMMMMRALECVMMGLHDMKMIDDDGCGG